MKRMIVLFTTTLLLFSGCAFHSGLTTNANLNTTEVVLAQNNYKVIASISGESKAMYVFGIGGLSKNGMIAEARTNMLANAEIVGESRAIINETVEIKHSFFPVVRMYTVVVSGHVVEFNK